MGNSPISRDEAIRLLTSGPEGVGDWNRRRSQVEHIPNLRFASLCRADLRGANFREAELTGADFRGADLRNADFSRAKLTAADFSGEDPVDERQRLFGATGASLRNAIFQHADLSDACLMHVDLMHADLTHATLRNAELRRADLSYADLSDATLCGADLFDTLMKGVRLNRADLREVNLNSANLQGAALSDANLENANLKGTNLQGALLIRTNLRDARLASASMGLTTLSALDLSVARSLEQVIHHGPSTVGRDTLGESKGRIPDKFLLGCGLAPWQILESQMNDPALTPHEISELQVQIFDKRTLGALSIAGVFVSYSHKNANFVDKLYESLTKIGSPVWLDRHDLLAGDLQKQVARAIRLQDVVILVLSEESIQSDWVENELDMARCKEKEQDRDVLCPVALDDSWKSKLKHKSSDRALWRTLTHKAVLDFSAWKTAAFDGQFNKLVRGLKLNY